MEENIVLSENKVQIKERKANKQPIITDHSSILIDDRSIYESRMSFETLGVSEVWGFEPSYTRSDDRCRECRWFDPACDICYFFGTARIDDLACESFHPAE